MVKNEPYFCLQLQGRAQLFGVSEKELCKQTPNENTDVLVDNIVETSKVSLFSVMKCN